MEKIKVIIAVGIKIIILSPVLFFEFWFDIFDKVFDMENR